MIEYLALIVAVILFVGSYFFYDSRTGRKSVYRSWYAGLIDFFAFCSGFYIFFIATILYLEGWSAWLIAPLFLGGSLQALMHVAKWLVRMELSLEKR